MTFVKKYDLSDPRDVEKLNKLLNLIGIAEIPHVSISHTWAAYPWVWSLSLTIPVYRGYVKQFFDFKAVEDSAVLNAFAIDNTFDFMPVCF